MKAIQPKELEKLSVISGVPVTELQKLHALGMLHANHVIA